MVDFIQTLFFQHESCLSDP